MSQLRKSSDRVVEAPVILSDLFPGASIGLAAGAPAADAVALGGTSILSFSPNGTGSSGSVYVVGRDGTQWCVRVLGVTARARVLRFEPSTNRRLNATDFGERRRVSRCIPVPTSALSRVRLRAGRELAVVNLSMFGTLVEGTTRLLPGTHVGVHVTAAQGRTSVRARVVRYAVWTVTADVITYRGALAFNGRVDLPPVDAASHPTSDAATRDP
jgi:hypothetical protein